MRMPLLVMLLSAVLSTPVTWAQQEITEGPLPMATDKAKARLDNNAVVRMTRAGLDVSLILQMVRTQPGQYATGPDDLISLKEAGVAPLVISAMAARSAGLSEHATIPVSVTGLSPDVDEQGVYHKDRDGRWVELPPELVHYKSGGWVKSTLTHDIVKKDRNGEISGAQSSLVLRLGDELEILAPPNVDAIEYQVLRFRLHSNSREFRADHRRRLQLKGRHGAGPSRGQSNAHCPTNLLA